MTAAECKIATLAVVDNYLSGKATQDDVWQWAQRIIVSNDFDDLPFEIQDAIHGLWLLHDKDAAWVPTTDEVRALREQLANFQTD